MKNNNEVTKQHVQLPNNMSENNLEIKDQLIYLVIKSHNNSNNECYPSLQTISEESGISIPTIRASIKRLEKEEYIKIKKNGRKNYYYFNPYKKFEPFSEDFIKRKDLSPLTKSYLVAIQQYMYKDIEGLGKISLSNRELASKINTSEFTVRTCNKELKSKNYLTIAENNLRDLETGCKTNTKIFNLIKLGQAVIWKLKEHDEQISTNTADIELLKKQHEMSLREIEDLKKLNNKLLDKIESLEKKQTEYIM